MSGETIVRGLILTIVLGTISVAFSLLFGMLLIKCKESKYKILSVLVTGFIELINGIPIILLLLFFYYTVLIISGKVVGVVVLSLVGMCELAERGSDVIRNNNLDSNFKTIFIVSIIEGIRELSRLINYSSLLSLIGVTELLRTLKTLVNSTDIYSPYLVGIVLYVVIHFILLYIYRFFYRKMISIQD